MILKRFCYCIQRGLLKDFQIYLGKVPWGLLKIPLNPRKNIFEYLQRPFENLPWIYVKILKKPCFDVTTDPSKRLIGCFSKSWKFLLLMSFKLIEKPSLNIPENARKTSLDIPKVPWKTLSDIFQNSSKMAVRNSWENLEMNNRGINEVCVRFYEFTIGWKRKLGIDFHSTNIC